MDNFDNLPVINVWYDPLPVPVRSHDWTACIVDEMDENTRAGHGATAAEAVADFLSRTDANREEFRVEIGNPFFWGKNVQSH